MAVIFPPAPPPSGGGSSVNSPFVNNYTGSAWTYTTEAAATAAGLLPGQMVLFNGNPGGSPAGWMRDSDLWTQG